MTWFDQNLYYFVNNVKFSIYKSSHYEDASGSLLAMILAMAMLRLLPLKVPPTISKNEIFSRII